MFLKIFGSGTKEYTRDFYNVFDGLVAILSIIELVFD